MLHVANKSTRVTDAQVQQMAEACNIQAAEFAGAYGRTPITVDYIADASQAQSGSWVITVLDDSDQQGALGYHTEEAGGIIFGRIFAAPVLDNGGSVMGGTSSPYSVSGTLSHEVLETIADPHANLDADTDQGLAVAYEVCDPCEDCSYPITISDGTSVAVSDYVLPQWFDPQAPATAMLDKMGQVKAPYQITSGGYVVTTKEGEQSQVFGHSNECKLHQPNAEDDQHMALHSAIAPGMLVTWGREVPAWRLSAKSSPGGRLDARARHRGGGITEEATLSESDTSGAGPSDIPAVPAAPEPVAPVIPDGDGPEGTYAPSTDGTPATEPDASNVPNAVTGDVENSTSAVDPGNETVQSSGQPTEGASDGDTSGQ